MVRVRTELEPACTVTAFNLGHILLQKPKFKSRCIGQTPPPHARKNKLTGLRFVHPNPHHKCTA